MTTWKFASLCISSLKKPVFSFPVNFFYNNIYSSCTNCSYDNTTDEIDNSMPTGQCVENKFKGEPLAILFTFMWQAFYIDRGVN